MRSWQVSRDRHRAAWYYSFLPLQHAAVLSEELGAPYELHKGACCGAQTEPGQPLFLQIWLCHSHYNCDITEVLHMHEAIQLNLKFLISATGMKQLVVLCR